MFRHVCFVNSARENKTLQAYFRGIRDGEQSIPLSVALKNSVFLFWDRIKSLASGDKVWLNAFVNDVHKLDFSEYDSLFSYGSKPIVKHICSFLKAINTACKIVQFDEGIGSECIESK